MRCGSQGTILRSEKGSMFPGRGEEIPPLLSAAEVNWGQLKAR